MKKINFILKATGEFKRRIAALFMVVQQSAILAAIECFHIAVEKRKMVITATDMENYLICTFDIDTDEKFELLVNAKKFYQFIRNSWEEDIRVEFQEAPLLLKMISGDFHLTLPTEEPMNFPKSPTDKEGTDKSSIYPVGFIDTQRFSLLLSTALRFVSNDDLRPSMTGVYFELKDNLLEIAATDAHCLYFNSTQLSGSNKNCKFIMPRKSGRIFLNNFQSGDFRLSASETKYCKIETNNTVLFFCQIDAHYPNYKVVIPDNKIKFFLARKDMVSFTKIATCFTNKCTHQVDFHTTHEKIQLTGGDKDFNENFSFKAPVYNPSIVFEPFPFALNLSFFDRIISCDKKEILVEVLHSGMPTKAVIINKNFLIMPLMINN